MNFRDPTAREVILFWIYSISFPFSKELVIEGRICSHMEQILPSQASPLQVQKNIFQKMSTLEDGTEENNLLTVSFIPLCLDHLNATVPNTMWAIDATMNTMNNFSWRAEIYNSNWSLLYVKLYVYVYTELSQSYCVQAQRILRSVLAQGYKFLLLSLSFF